jgi:hypothetical protein
MANTQNTEPKELEALLKQYEQVRAVINLHTSLQNNTINYSIALIAASFVILTLKDKSETLIILQYPMALLVLSIFLSLITWSVLEAEIAIHDLTSFIHKKLSVQIREAMKLSPEKKDYFKMELPILSKEKKLRHIMRGVMVSGKFFISFFPSLASFILFFKLRNGFQNLDFFSWVVVSISGLMLLSIPVVLISHSRFVLKYYSK